MECCSWLICAFWGVQLFLQHQVVYIQALFDFQLLKKSLLQLLGVAHQVIDVLLCLLVLA